MIVRNEYLELLRPIYHSSKVKIIMGVRRCGKTTLLNQIIDELISDGVDKNYIHLINLDSFNSIKYKNTSILNKYLSNLFKDKKKHYLFIDEVQNINDWEKVVGIFNYGYDLSIFVTGSCSNLIDSKNIHFIEDYICINMFPFSYRELTSIKSDKELFDNYIEYGSMPLIYNEKNEMVRSTYINDVYNSIVVKDIVERYNVKDVELLNKIIGYILSTLSIPFSVNSMASYFETYDRKVSLDTMYNYLEYINSTYMINKLERYSINDNRVIFGKYKYYLSDINFSNVVDNNIIESKKYKLENAVFNELLSKGYKVYQAIVGTKLVDFIAFKDNRKVSIEILCDLDNQKEVKNSVKKLKHIDNCEKYILSLDDINEIKDEIVFKNIKEFLLNNDL